MIKRFVAIGHVDTGKSCLCGHLLYQIGYIEEREMDKIRRRAEKDKMVKWIWSRVLDIYEEEMLKGKTHEFNKLTFERKLGEDVKKYELIDTPGHGTFVRSMIEGINQNVNIAVLLVSMADNEFESSFERGMLKEHLILARATGIEHLLIVANKMDLVEWNQEDFMKKTNKVYKYVKKRLGWPKENIKVVPIAAYDGIGLTNKDGMPEWYQGKSLLDTLDSMPFDQRKQIIISGDHKAKQFKAKIRIIHSDNDIVPAGTRCVMCYEGKEAPIMIEKIKGKRFLRVGEQAECLIKLEYPIALEKGLRILFRQKKNTIGFGDITKLK